MIIGSLEVSVNRPAPGKLVLVAQMNPIGVSTPITPSELRDLGHMLIREADKPSQEN